MERPVGTKTKQQRDFAAKAARLMGELMFHLDEVYEGPGRIHESDLEELCGWVEETRGVLERLAGDMNSALERGVAPALNDDDQEVEQVLFENDGAATTNDGGAAVAGN